MLCGLSYEDVWVNMKPIEVKEYVEQYNKNKMMEYQIQYNLCWLNALYNHISKNNPKDFPKKPEQIYKEEQSYQSDEEQEQIIDFLLSQINTKNN